MILSRKTHKIGIPELFNQIDIFPHPTLKLLHNYLFTSSFFTYSVVSEPSDVALVSGVEEDGRVGGRGDE